MAVLAAIPGIIDYRYTVPPDSAAKDRASIHTFLNVCMLALFGTALHLTLTIPSGTRSFPATGQTARMFLQPYLFANG